MALQLNKDMLDLKKLKKEAQDFLANQTKETYLEMFKEIDLEEALKDPKWVAHKIGDKYSMDKDKGDWKIAYYPLMQEEGEPKALVEKPIFNGANQIGTDFREVPLRYLEKTTANHVKN